MKIFRIVDIQRCEKSENIGLNGANQQFQRADEGDEDDAEKSHEIAGTTSVKRLDDKAGEHLDQNVAGDHCNEQSQGEAERTHEEGQQLNQEDKRNHHRWRTMRNEQAEKFEAMFPEPDDQNDRKADRCQQAGDGKLAGYGERMDAGDDPEWHQAEQIGEENEHEQSEHPGRIFLAVGSNAGGDDIVDKADYTFDHDLPATGNQLALHSAHHEHIEKTEDDKHPQRAVGEIDLLTKESEAIKDGLHFKLVHRINFAFGSH